MSTSTATEPSELRAAGMDTSRPAVFATTQWSAVLSAGRNDTTRARAALAQLCKTYWYPLYAYVRQRGHSAHDAQDLTQEFFARLLEKNSLGRVTRGRGKFRSFLLAAMNHFLADEWKRARAQKRGGGHRAISLDAHDAETRFEREAVDKVTPERLYEQNWALALLDTVYHRLRREYETGGRGHLFDTLKFSLTGSRSAMPYADLAKWLGLTESAVKVAVHRLRQRYRELLREEVAQTVASPGEVEEELRGLFRALASG